MANNGRCEMLRSRSSRPRDLATKSLSYWEHFVIPNMINSNHSYSYVLFVSYMKLKIRSSIIHHQYLKWKTYADIAVYLNFFSNLRNLRDRVYQTFIADHELHELNIIGDGYFSQRTSAVKCLLFYLWSFRIRAWDSRKFITNCEQDSVNWILWINMIVRQ
jgi:hypothetical protein